MSQTTFGTSNMAFANTVRHSEIHTHNSLTSYSHDPSPTRELPQRQTIRATGTLWAQRTLPSEAVGLRTIYGAAVACPTASTQEMRQGTARDRVILVRLRATKKSSKARPDQDPLSTLQCPMTGLPRDTGPQSAACLQDDRYRMHSTLMHLLFNNGARATPGCPHRLATRLRLRPPLACDLLQ